MEEQKDVRSYNVGGSDYSKHKYQVWDIVKMYGLNFWEGNMLKYLLRKKEGNDRLMDLRKIEHYLDYYATFERREVTDIDELVDIEELLSDYDTNIFEDSLIGMIIALTITYDANARNLMIAQMKNVLNDLMIYESMKR